MLKLLVSIPLVRVSTVLGVVSQAGGMMSIPSINRA